MNSHKKVIINLAQNDEQLESGNEKIVRFYKCQARKILFRPSNLNL